MDVESLTAYCLGKPGAWPDSPWANDQVAKVGPGERGKIFAFLGEESVGVKCGASREEADTWLARYPEDARVMPYIGRSGWNTLLVVGGRIPHDEILEAVDQSYRLVTGKLPKSLRPAGWDV